MIFRTPIDSEANSPSLEGFIKEKIVELSTVRNGDDIVNQRPVIGIIDQPRHDNATYIMAAYVKFLEQAGARVVPIHYNSTDEELITLVSKLNGVLYAGGSTVLNNEDGSLTEYSRKGKVILDKVKEMNDNGSHVPVWAVCLGFQEITVIEAPYPDVLIHNKFDSDNVANNITFPHGVSNSKLYGSLPTELIIAIQAENITYNSHHDGVYPKTYEAHESLRQYHMLGVSYDNKGVEYVAVVEHKKYPIFGMQYHPEKNAFIWKTDLFVPHSQTAIKLEQALANFFVTEAKKNANKFDSEAELRKLLIENNKVIFTEENVQDIYVFYK